MGFISAREIIEYLDVIKTQNIPEVLDTNGISTDTRTLKRREIFVALKGENYDGHNFIEEAHRKGALFSIVNKQWAIENPNSAFPLIVVEDTLFALGQLGNLFRSKFNIPFVAIAGSNGKTTTKDFVAHILSKRFKVLKTEGNLNNQIGVPLTLFKLNSDHEVAVVEIGTNQFGEIARLCEILEPTHGVITNIGKEHLEAFIDLDGVEMEETTLYGYLLKHEGLAFINTDDPRLKKYTQILEKQFTYGQDKNNNLRFSIELNEKLIPNVTFEYEDKKFSVRLKNPGYSIAFASIPAVAVGLSFGLSVEEILEGLRTFVLPEFKDYGRMLVKTIGNLTIINDTYNANPTSMELALETVKRIASDGKKFAVLGDMLELGEVSEQEHKNIIHLASKVCNDVFIYGNEMKRAFEQKPRFENVHYFDDKFDITNKLLEKINGNDVILFKASRGMKCEEVLSNFINKISQ
ncbi:MAG: UDP-N-acetylmuramoyl-tripeptide--D-alanyl-D-alanine ligase [Candidatus Kapaibacteriota bacterium]